MYEIQNVRRDGSLVRQLKCPKCGTWQDVDDDQFHGRVSLECSTPNCSFHETVDLHHVGVTRK